MEGRMEGLAGKRALVTGGASGHRPRHRARAGALGLRHRPHRHRRRHGERDRGRDPRAGAGSQGSCGRRVDAGSVRAALAQLGERGPPVDILVNNAGIARLGSLLTMPEKDWRDTFAVNVDGTFNVSRAVVPGMVARRRGAVVNLASWLGRRGQPPFGAYAASKFAIIGHDAGAGGGGCGGRRARQCRLPGPDRRHAHARGAGRGIRGGRAAAGGGAGEVDPDRPRRHAGGCGQGGGVPRLRRGGLRHRRGL